MIHSEFFVFSMKVFSTYFCENWDVQELLDLKQKERSGTQLVQEIRKQANDVQSFRLSFFVVLSLHRVQLLTNNIAIHIQARTSTISMPYRIQKIEEFVQQLESGDLKLRVRVLEVHIQSLHKFLGSWITLISANIKISLLKTLQYSFLKLHIVMGFLVWKSSKESNNTSDGNDVHRDGWYPFEPRNHPELSRQPSCCKRIICWSRWALFRRRSFKFEVQISPPSFCEMQEFSWRLFFDVCKGLKSSTNLRRWSDFCPQTSSTFLYMFNIHALETLLYNPFNKHIIDIESLFLHLFFRAKA